MDGTQKERNKIPQKDSQYAEGGYGWLICLGGFIMYIMLGGIGKIFTFIFEDLRIRMGTSAATTALIPAIHSSCKMLTGTQEHLLLFFNFSHLFLLLKKPL